MLSTASPPQSHSRTRGQFVCSVWTPLSRSWIPCGSCLQGFCGTRALLSLALMSFTTRQFPTQQHCQAVSQLTLLGSVLLSLRVAYLNSYTHPAPRARTHQWGDICRLGGSSEAEGPCTRLPQSLLGSTRPYRHHMWNSLLSLYIPFLADWWLEPAVSLASLQ